MATQTTWYVYLGNKHIDTVFYNPECEYHDVYDGLVNHDGYNPNIKLLRRLK